MTNIATEYRTLVVKERAAFFDPRCTQLRDRMTDADIQRTVAMLSFLSSIRIDRGRRERRRSRLKAAPLRPRSPS